MTPHNFLILTETEMEHMQRANDLAVTIGSFGVTMEEAQEALMSLFDKRKFKDVNEEYFFYNSLLDPNGTNNEVNPYYNPNYISEFTDTMSETVENVQAAPSAYRLVDDGEIEVL
jgi:hypothetical protein